MSANNNWSVLGTLCFDPALKTFGSGSTKGTMRLAVRKPKKNGVDQSPLWVDVVFWGKLAELVHEKFKKGDGILVSGEMDMEEWTDKATGEKRSKPVLLAREMAFLPRPKGGESSGDAVSVPAADDLDDMPF